MGTHAMGSLNSPFIHVYPHITVYKNTEVPIRSNGTNNTVQTETGISLLMKSSVGGRLGPGHQHPADGRGGQHPDQDRLQRSDADSRCDDARHDREQGTAHLRKDEDECQRRRVDLVREELGAQRYPRREEGTGEETDETDGDGGGDDVWDPGIVQYGGGDDPQGS